jgi:heavy metal sensor kinase
LAESANPASSDLRVDRNWQWSRRVLHSDNATGPYPPGFHQTLVLLTGVSVQGDRHLLQFLALTLLGVSTVILLLAALGGRWLCQRALLPLAQMAQSARSISGADMSERLQIPSTKDELIALAQAFNDLLARLEDAFERQRRFTGEASHQLRTPLAAMLGQVEVALRRERTSAEYRVTLDTVHHEARRMVQIVEMLLFLARTDSAALDLHLEPTELAVWLTEHLQRWQGHPRGRDIEMLGETISLRTHPVMLGQAVDNLLDNACKYSQPGTAIKVRLEQDPNEVRLIVEDQGCGIDPEDLPYLFSPFFRSHAARRQGIVGVGLGLAVVSRIVQALGGQVRVTSVVGSGSRFVMRFGEVDAGCVKNRHDSVR